MNVTAYSIAQRFVGLKEVPGKQDNSQVLAMLRLDGAWPEHDEVPWCSAFVNYICWLLRLPRSKKLSARSWLGVGAPVSLGEAQPGYDVVILKRGLDSPGADVLDAPGHVGFFAEYDVLTERTQVLGGNQNDEVCVLPYPVDRVLGVRRLFEEVPCGGKV